MKIFKHFFISGGILRPAGAGLRMTDPFTEGGRSGGSTQYDTLLLYIFTMISFHST
jgi:hypothetical protein